MKILDSGGLHRRHKPVGIGAQSLPASFRTTRPIPSPRERKIRNAAIASSFRGKVIGFPFLLRKIRKVRAPKSTDFLPFKSHIHIGAPQSSVEGKIKFALSRLRPFRFRAQGLTEIGFFDGREKSHAFVVFRFTFERACRIRFDFLVFDAQTKDQAGKIMMMIAAGSAPLSIRGQTVECFFDLSSPKLASADPDKCCFRTSTRATSSAGRA